METVDNFILGVSPLTGEAYITNIDRNGLMTDNKRKLSRNEILSFIYQWSLEESRKINNNTITIEVDGKTILEINIK
jgi:transcription termination factor NusB